MAKLFSMTRLQFNIRRWTIFLGVLQIAVGCVVGFIPPGAVSWFRGIVMSHIEYTANGVLMVVSGLLVGELLLNSKALIAWFISLQIGTWTNGTAGVIAAVTGASSSLMPTINEKFPPPNGTNHAAVSGVLMVCGVTMLIALGLTLYGLIAGLFRKSTPPN